MATADRGVDRRTFLAGLGLAPLCVRNAFGQTSAAPALPLKNLGLEHLDILVPDTAASGSIARRCSRNVERNAAGSGSPGLDVSASAAGPRRIIQ